MTMIQNLESTLIEHFKREGIAISEKIGERLQDISYQIAWNVFHFKKGNAPIYPMQVELMQRLDYLSPSGELTKPSGNLFNALSQSGYYVELDF